jgi:phenylalanyl-tRNA synthetase alpha chain
MEIAQFLEALDRFRQDAEAAFANAETAEQLEELRIEFLGAKQGRLKSLQKELGALDPDARKLGGQRFNAAKDAVQGAFQARQDQQATGITRKSVPSIDLTLPGVRPELGSIHPITQTISELTDIMGRLGFSVTEGPEIEDEWHNFEALNIAPEHPARDPLDNFYLMTADRLAGNIPVTAIPRMLRSQTSTVQIRVMEKTQPPIRIISLGRVYRPDEVDATHYPMFHQMEGLMIDQNVTMAHLKSVLRLFATSYLGQDVAIRFRPSFFPFTEPSVEVDFQWNSGWIEFGGAGMVDPNVLRMVGYDPEKVSGFAFGLGIERLCMRRHQITDIRELYRNDVRFLRQFA